jgi:alpha-glucosidase
VKAFLGTLVACVVLIPMAVRGQGTMPVAVGDVTSVDRLSNGVVVHAGAAAMKVEALRDDAVRVRVTPEGVWQEDASWAVLPAARTASIAVKPLADGIGFTTAELKVVVERSPMRLRVEDLAGHVISEDAVGYPVTFRGTRTAQGGAFQVWKTLRGDEHFFGLGDKTGPLDRLGEVFVDWNRDSFDFQESTDPIYKSIPFFLGESAGRYYGVFVNNTWRTVFDFGKSMDNAYSFASEGGPLDYTLLYGPTPRKVVEDYAWLTGPSPLPPLWALGFQQSRYSYDPESEVRDVARNFRERKIPADVIWLDIDYQDAHKPFTVDKDDFPDMPKLIADMRAKGFHMVAITDLHIANQPGKNYAPYDTGIAQDVFVKTPEGKNYLGESWPGSSLFPDFSSAKTRTWWGENYKQFYGWGFGGFWNDMDEPSIRNGPDHTMPSSIVEKIQGDEAEGFADRTTTHRELHNVYGMLNARATEEGLVAIKPDERPFVMTRASFAGGQRYSVTWTGDNSSTWNHLRLADNMLLNLGLSGYAWAGADVGGFIGSPSPDLLTKWIETAAFQPIDRDHTAGQSLPQEPWQGTPEQIAVRKHYIETRYRLLPYVYTAAEETSRTGVPVMRPMFLEFPQMMIGGMPMDIGRIPSGEYMWGPDLMVAPEPFPDKINDYRPDFPTPGWYDFWTGRRFPPLAKKKAQDEEHMGSHEGDEPQGGMIHPRIDVLPVFVRPGAIFPMQAVVQSTEETPAGPLELHVYPGGANDACAGSVYTDDGHTMAYKRGVYLRVAVTCMRTPAGFEVTLGKQEGTFVPWWKQIEVVVHGSAAGKVVAEARGQSPAARYDAASLSWHVVIARSEEAETVMLKDWVASAK